MISRDYLDWSKSGIWVDLLDSRIDGRFSATALFKETNALNSKLLIKYPRKLHQIIFNLKNLNALVFKG